MRDGAADHRYLRAKILPARLARRARAYVPRAAAASKHAISAAWRALAARARISAWHGVMGVAARRHNCARRGSSARAHRARHPVR